MSLKSARIWKLSRTNNYALECSDIDLHSPLVPGHRRWRALVSTFHPERLCGQIGGRVKLSPKKTLRQPPYVEHRLSNSTARLSWSHDGAFPLRKHLCGASGQFFRAGCTDAGRGAETDQIEPAACDSSRPRPGPAR